MLRLLTENRAWRNVLLLIICIGLLTPSYFINNIDSHDWGGDFAMYIKQAENVVVGVPQTDNNYIFNSENAVLGPKTYPIGFPLMLAPVYTAFGNDISAFIDLIAVLSVLFGLMVFVLLRERVGWALALIVSLGISYHTTLLFFKREVMADIPFALFALLALLAIDKKKWWLAGLALLIAVLTKSVGITLLIAVGFLLFVQRQKAVDSSFRALVSSPITRVVAFAAFGYFLLSNVVFQTASSEGYSGVWSTFELTTVISNNLNYYYEFLRWFLFDSISETTAGSVVTIVFLIVALLGWVVSSYKKLGAIEVWFPVYIAVLLAYPYHASGLRFLLPLIPLLFLFAAEFFALFSKRYKQVLVLAAAIPFLFTYQRSLETMKNWPGDVDGPQSVAAVALFDFVKNETASDSKFLFNKPRVLSLYTNREAIGNGRFQSQESLQKQVDSIPINYLIHAEQLWNPGLDTLLMNNKELTELIYDKDGFRVYRIN